jgi:UDP-N-acetyl-D-glucosamine dehydrogenase
MSELMALRGDPLRVVIVGQGYVGLPLAMCCVNAGHDVVGYDVDAERIKRLINGESYVEDVATSQLAAALATGRYLATAAAGECAEFDVAVITVPTPLREGVPELRHIEEAVRVLGAHLRPGATVVLESTTYPGTTQELVAPLLEEISGLTAGLEFHLGYSPERIDPGNPTWQLHNTPKVVSGLDHDSLAAVQSFYDTVVDTTVPVSSTQVAELAKLLENTFRHVNIALVNELAMFARDLDISVWEAVDAAATKPYGFMKFSPGPGVGGHCLPIDPSYLSWRVKRATGRTFRFVELANDVNDHMPDYVVQRITGALNRQRLAVNGSRILLLGLAYKRNTGDARESPARRIIELLIGLGADIHAVDPLVVEAHVDPRVRRVDLTTQEIESADAVVLLTDHDTFDAEQVTRHARYVLDCRKRLPSADTVEIL